MCVCFCQGQACADVGLKPRCVSVQVKLTDCNIYMDQSCERMIFR